MTRVGHPALPVLLLIVGSMCGCGNPGSPLPPSLMLPVPVKDLAATRIGDVVTLSWMMPERTTDRVKLESDQRVAVCRATGAGPCDRVGLVLSAPGIAAHYEDTLPTAVASGALRLLRYEVRLENRKGRDAGASNPAYAAAGAAPPAVRDVSARTTAKGITVSWQPGGGAAEAPASAKLVARLERERIPKAGESGGAEGKEPLRRTLEAVEHEIDGRWEPESTLDTEAVLDRSYRYTVRLVERETVDGHGLEVAGEPGESGVFFAKNSFPPPAPTELAAAADAQGGTIDLSWTEALPMSKGSELAGFVVYRRAEASTGAPQRVSGAKPVAAPAWSDHSAQKGVRYAYSVAAVDADGNESARSQEAVAGLPE